MSCHGRRRRCAELVANSVSHLGGADLHVQSRQKVERCAVSGWIVNKVRPDLDIGVGSIRAGCRFNRQTRWKRCLEAGNPLLGALAGPRSNDQGRNKGDLRRPMPAVQSEKRIGAHEAKQSAVRRECSAQTLKRLQRKVGLAGGFWRIGKRNSESRLAGNGHLGHGQAVFIAGRRSMRLERLCANRGKEHGIQPKSRTSSARNRQMAQMGRVKAAAEEGNATGAGW